MTTNRDMRRACQQTPTLYDIAGSCVVTGTSNGECSKDTTGNSTSYTTSSLNFPLSLFSSQERKHRPSAYTKEIRWAGPNEWDGIAIMAFPWRKSCNYVCMLQAVMYNKRTPNPR